VPELDKQYWSGRRVWVVGASSGIGRAVALAVSQAGADVIASARSEDSLRETAAQAERKGGRIEVAPMDVTDQVSVDQAVAKAGQVDTLLYSAGNWKVTDVDNWSYEQIERQHIVNYLGMVRCVVALLPSMMERRSGTLAAVTSISGYAPLPRAEGYGSSKAAANYFLSSLRADIRSRGVRVVTIAPGFIDTPLTRENDFPMPFMIRPDQAAVSIAKGLESGSTEIHFPKRLTLAVKLLGWMPRPARELTTRLVYRR
jgi:short-subunit dehydrogenase